MWEALDRFGILWLDAGLAATVLLGAFALAMVGSRQPARRRSLARAAILGSLALAPLVALDPSRRRVEVIGPLRAVFDAIPLSGWPEKHLARVAGAYRHACYPGRSETSARLIRWGPRAVTLLYLGGVAVGLGWLVLGWWCSGWLIRRSVPPSEGALAVYEALPSGGWVRPRLLVAGSLRRPVLLGAIRPTILIPPDLDRPGSREQLRLSLLHELAHAESADPFFGSVGAVAQAAWFFVPWLWWIRRQMRLDQEFLADRCASDDFGPFGTYASSLVDLADPGLRRSGPAARAGVWGAGSALVQRVLMLVRCPYVVETRAPRWWRLALLPVVAGATLMASSLTLRSAEPPPAREGPHEFRLARLVIAESPAGPDGSVRPYLLPLPLPERFDLTLDVYADLAELAETFVAGYRLARPIPDDVDIGPPRWFHVRLRRDRRGPSLAVDGVPVPLLDDGQPTQPWFSLQPPADRPGIYKNLIVIW